MTERPILFTPANAQKVHEGTKTQTRRIVKKRPPYLYVEEGKVLRMDRYGEYHLHNPYGQVGDRLWVREAWRLAGDDADATVTEDKAWFYTDQLRYRGEPHSEGIDKWRPSIHMPRWACRTVLEITNVRVERLQEISEADALAEGVTGPHMVGYPAYRVPGDSKPRFSSAVAAYEDIWTSIHGLESWDANPWVWVLEFKKV
jgi:hypothetical protein